LQIQMPAEEINGVLAGGLLFQEVTEQTVAQEGEVAVVISYVIALLLHQGTPSKPDILLNEISMNRIGEQVRIHANLQNIHPAFANQLAINIQITHGETGAIILSEEQGGMQMAPHSNFDFAIYASASLFQEGEEYRIVYTLSSGEISWEFQEYILAEISEDTGEIEEVGGVGEEGETTLPPVQEQDRTNGFGDVLSLVIGLVGGMILGAGGVLVFLRIQRILQKRDARVDEIQKRFIASTIEREE